ncbi:MAG: 30S ribosomal protein S16 [Chloroflexi bacterium]|nr:30S ribosomal protein S16 [Chloroflexota bacterium]
MSRRFFTDRRGCVVKIRLRRVGAKKQPAYRLVAADSRSPRNGAFIEVLGHYNPRTDPPTVVVNAERARHWLEHGAQPTATVASLLRKAGVLGAGAAAPEAPAGPA